MGQLKAFFLSSAAASTLLAGGQVWAQAAPAATPADTGAIETVIVTAQRRAENAQNVPVALSALTGTALESRGINETSDLMGSVPNLQVTSAYGRTQPNFSLRGISVANEFSASTASPIGVYVDEVYQSFRASHGQQLFDLDRVEVVRGPQGTLYGRNTTGGAVNFITRKPSLSGSSGEISLGYANFNTITAGGNFEVTPAENVFGVRGSFTYGKGDGYTYNPTLNQDFSTTDYISGRLVAVWQASENLRATAKIYAGQNNPRQDIPYGIGYLTGRTDAGGYSRFAPRPELGGRVLKQDEIQADTAGKYFTSTSGVTLTIDYDINDKLKFTSVSGYDKGEYRLSPFDCDGSPNDVCAIRYYSESTGLNQDLRFTWQDDKKTLIGGFYIGQDDIYTHNEPDFFGFLAPLLTSFGVPGAFFNAAIAGNESLKTIPAFLVNPALTPTSPGYCAPIVINPNGFFDGRSLIAFQTDVAATNSAGGTASQAACAAAGAPPFQNILADQKFDLVRPSTAIYGEGKFDLTDKFALTFGLRYTWDEVRYENARSVIRNLGGTIAAGLVPYSFPYNPNAPAVNRKEKTGEFSGRIVASYNFAKDVLGYASYSRGYRSGTYNGLAYQASEQVYFVEPELVNAYEIGFKSQFASNRVQLNGAAFYYDYSNQQIAEIIGATSFLRNANGKVQGFEAEGQFRATRNLRFDASIGVLNTEYDANQRFRVGGLDIGGNEFPNAPNLTFGAGMDWTVYQGTAGSVYLRLDANYMGEFWFDPYNDYNQAPCDKPAPGLTILAATPELACGNPAYWLSNARVTWENERFAVSAWVKNLTDEFYYTYGLNLNAFYQDYLTRGTPRTFGIDVKARF
jgi:iron complex outermembrane recepter protein